jgi:hypothetical protein
MQSHHIDNFILQQADKNIKRINASRKCCAVYSDIFSASACWIATGDRHCMPPANTASLMFPRQYRLTRCFDCCAVSTAGGEEENGTLP